MRKIWFNALSAVVVIALLGASFALVGGHTNRGSPSTGGYSPFQGVSGKYTLTIKETGLPAGHPWNVSLGGDGSGGFVSTINSSSSTIIQFTLANGNYSFTPASVGYASNVTMTTPNQRPDSVTVSGSNLTYNVYFNKTYDVTLIESGLPSGMNWMAALTDLSYNDVGSSNITSSSTHVFELVNGTWIASAVPFVSGYSGYKAYFNNSDQTYQDLNINGAPMTVYIHFIMSYNVNFTETGLPSSSIWTINIANSSMESKGIFNTVYATATTANYTIPEFNGTWYYSISTSVPGGYFAYPSSGSISVSGNNVSVAVTFSTSPPSGYYFLNFTETGLSPGTSWGVTLKGNPESSSISNTISFPVANGTYSYIVGNVSGYTRMPSSGNITVSGSSVVQTVRFTPFATTPPVWAFVGAYADYSVTSVYKGSTSSGNLTMQAIAVNLTNNTVELRITSQGAPSGSTSITTLYIDWNDFSFWLGKGLISELNNGTSPLGPNASVSTSIKVSTPDGIFLTDRVVLSANGQDMIFYYDMFSGILVAIYETNSTGSITANITSTNIPEGGTALSSYTVSFSESGLPAGMAWYVNLSNGMTYASTSGTISIQEPNGSYSYSVASSNKTFRPSPASGSFTVNGGSVSVSITFSQTARSSYTVTFSETGLPSGTLWYVIFNGANKSSTTGTITFTAPNGTYSFTVGSVSGYSVSVSSGSISVNGNNVSNTITFSPIKKSSSGSGMAADELYGIFGGVISAVAIVSVLAFMRKRR